KKLVLASAAALVLAGAVAGTGEVRALNYSSDSRYLTQNGSSRRDILRAAKQNGELQLRNVLSRFKSELKDEYSGYFNYYLRLIKRSYNEDQIDKYVETLRKDLADRFNYEY
ncbi:TPA: hypothetical protein TVL19_001983, partial [Streptococcus equi subsp. zooepidemicus]|nr:hypothetical protein [Streptococcus equi subsp. zooepidemicus]